MSITVQIRSDSYNEIMDAMTSLGGSAVKKPLSKAINQTARAAKKVLKADARSRYLVNAPYIESKTKYTASRVSTLRAKIKYAESSRGVEHFETSDGDGVSAKVLRSGTMKPLIVGGRKAFFTDVSWTSKSGESGTHHGVFQRKGKKRLPIKHIYGITVPKMIENQNVLQQEEPDIGQDLQDNIKAAIDAVLGGAGK